MLLYFVAARIPSIKLQWSFNARKEGCGYCRFQVTLLVPAAMRDKPTSTLLLLCQTEEFSVTIVFVHKCTYSLIIFLKKSATFAIYEPQNTYGKSWCNNKYCYYWVWCGIDWYFSDLYLSNENCFMDGSIWYATASLYWNPISSRQKLQMLSSRQV